jgi:hypothetical protein
LIASGEVRVEELVREEQKSEKALVVKCFAYSVSARVWNQKFEIHLSGPAAAVQPPCVERQSTTPREW